MSDTFLTADAPAPDATVTETPVQTPGTGTVAPETNAPEDGSSQEATEGGQQQTGQRRGKSLMDEVKELRAQRRELRDQVRSFDSVRNELAELRDLVTRRDQEGTAKTPANFWQDPEGALDRRLQNLRDELSQTFQQTREQEFHAQQLRQEQASAVEFIRSQQGYHQQDDEDLIEIIEGIPKRTREASSPSMIAEYAWMKLQQARGVGDRSLSKQRASGVQGQPPGTGFGRKNWSRAEFDAAVDMIEKNPSDPKHAELLKELEAAHKEGRVR